MPEGLSSLSHDGAIAAFVSLLAAFQHAVVYAGFPERLTVTVESKGAAARLDALSDRLMRAARGHPMEGTENSDEAEGIEMATSIIRQIITDVRQGFRGSNRAAAPPSTS